MAAFGTIHRAREVSQAADHARKVAAMKKCPYGDAILHYARERGLQNARLEYEGAFGWCLYGDGRYNGWPLVWAVARELGIDRGCGDATSHQIKPELF